MEGEAAVVPGDVALAGDDGGEGHGGEEGEDVEDSHVGLWLVCVFLGTV